jgi:hypothetical protein
MKRIQITNSIFCRNATSDDIERVASLHVQYWREIYCPFLPESVFEDRNYEFRLSQWQEWFEENNPKKVLQLITSHENTIIGFMFFEPNHELYMKDADCSLGLICIPAELRGAVGRSVLAIWYQTVLDTGYKVMSGWAFTENIAQQKRLQRSSNFEMVAKRVYSIGGRDIPAKGYICRDIQKEIDRLTQAF